MLGLRSNIKKCNELVRLDRMLDETLFGAISSDEHGAYIKQNIEIIAKNKKALVEIDSEKHSDAKRVAKYHENIAICKSSVREHLRKLGATPDVSDMIINCINSGDYQSVTLNVLKLMAVKNPGLNQKKYEQALKIFAAKKQNQH